MFRLGQAHYEAGEFISAGEYFEQAYRLSGRAPLLFNAYVAFRDGQDLPNATRTLRTYLDENASIPPLERDQLAARLAAMERTLSQLQSNQTEDPDTEPEVATETATETETEAATEVPAPSGTTSAAGSESGGFNPSPVGFIVAGAGAALMVGGLVTGIMANGEESTLSRSCDGMVCPDEPALRDAASRGETLALTTDILLIGGGVALATGVVLLFVLQNDDDGDSAVSAGASCTRTGCFGSVATRF